MMAIDHKKENDHSSFDEKYSPQSSEDEMRTPDRNLHSDVTNLKIIENTSNKVNNKWQCCKNCCKPCLRKHHLNSNKPYLCPPIGWVADIITWIIILLLIWGVMAAVLGKIAHPGGHLFALYLLVIFGFIGGWVITLIRLPPLLGMLLVGIAVKNIPYIDFAKAIDSNWSSTLRSIALVVILTRAGLGLDPNVLKRLKVICLRLAFLPCLAEATSVGILSYFILNFEWLWGFMLGFVLAAVSPAVIVPSMLNIQKEGLGESKGISTIIIAAASLDDVLAISGFSILLGITFSNSNLIFTIFRGPLEALMGIAFGCLLGITIWFIPNSQDAKVYLYRIVILFLGGLFAVFGSHAIDFPGAGALGCLVLSFVAAMGWKKRGLKNQNPIASVMADIWVIFQPILFGLIGTEINVSQLEGKIVGLGLAVVVISLIVRMSVSALAVLGAGLNKKEILFVAIAWLPKATVQAAIGSIALDTARKKGDPYSEDLGLKILIIAVLVILITAPLGAAAISLSAPRLLTKAETSKMEEVGETELSLIHS